MSEAERGGFGFDRLIRDLSDGRRFPGSASDIEVVHTHISVVFLVGGRAYKLKKPKDLGFLDFTTLERRRRYCHEEVRLNRRLAPHVYEGVVAVVDDGDGPRVTEEVWPEGADVPGSEEGRGRVVEWAVRMVRLPEERTLRRLLRADRAGEGELARLADRLAAFHASAEGGARIAEGGGWATVSGNNAENHEQLEPFAGQTIGATVFERLRELTTRELRRLRPVIERRAAEGVPRDTHGDLRLGHIYLLPPGTPGTDPRSEPGRDGEDEIVAIDCIEFNERFRWADPVADIAFTAMELEFENRPDLAGGFLERYFSAAEDDSGRELVPYYTSYRDVVRGKVRSFEAEDEGVPERTRERAAAKATRHFLRALDRLAEPAERPALVLVYGLPGVGKSTLARALAERAGFEWLDTDRVRKELFGAEDRGDEASKGGFEEGLYTPDRTRRTYAACLERASTRLFDGGRVVVEGSFRQDGDRRAFLAAADRLGVRALLLECVVSGEEARRRLAGRTDDPSDADHRIHREMVDRWEAHSAETSRQRRTVSLEGDAARGLDRAVRILVDAGLAPEG